MAPRADDVADRGGSPMARRAVAADVPVLVEVLARAFDDDPVPRWLFRGDRRRRRALRRFFGVQLRHVYLDSGEVWTTADLAGAALWAPPGTTRPGLRDLLHLLPLLPTLAGMGGDVPEALRLLAAVDRARPRVPHWYLATLGTDPARQGTGVGSTLVHTVLARVDEQGLPTHLESSKESNLAFYGRLGFTVTGEIHAAGGPTLWLMWREPRPPSR